MLGLGNSVSNSESLISFDSNKSSRFLFLVSSSASCFFALDNKNFLCSQVEQRLWSRKYIDKETGLKWDIKGIDSSGGLNLSKEDKVKVLSDYA